jgi:ferredoxin
LDLRLAPCEQQCNVCGQVCPTGAIRPLPLDERIHAKIGTAILRRERCLVWEQDKTCLVCDEICPYDAIEFREAEGMRRPFVTENRCNGCGQCEYVCPVEGDSAIVVVRMGEMRLPTGSYRLEATRKGYVFEGAREQDYEIIQPFEEEQVPPGFSLDSPPPP